MRDREPTTTDPGELTRKRFARRQWARRWLVWRYAVAATLALVALAVGVWLVFFSSVLAVQGVEVQGNDLIPAERVRAVAAVPTGEPLARADLQAIRDRLEGLPAVESVDVSRQWPDTILVSVTERVAVAVVENGGGFRGMDAEGVVFRSYARRPAGLPLIKAAPQTRGEAMAEGAAVVAVLPPDVVRKVSYVELRTVDQISLRLRDGRTVVWGSADRAVDKARVLDALLTQPGRVYDVSVPGQPTVR